ncbi:hypothetical protein IWQ60_010463 [Tieghemiomyces parasiticus]|uniref:Uncharacterized protein n=1 Tax=Tieghemiomyces parasiticus TaxID=78921 RepID=A0A9W7ZSY1_9FUNG|nr:hypothetical protein IWQ60_010463 [Tieghemiomyces parasiticus]
MLSRQSTRLTLTNEDLSQFESQRLDYARQRPELFKHLAATFEDETDSTSPDTADDPAGFPAHSTLEASLQARARLTTAQRIGAEPAPRP